jgi:hypothetical protein
MKASASLGACSLSDHHDLLLRALRSLTFFPPAFGKSPLLVASSESLPPLISLPPLLLLLCCPRPEPLLLDEPNPELEPELELRPELELELDPPLRGALEELLKPDKELLLLSHEYGEPELEEDEEDEESQTESGLHLVKGLASVSNIQSPLHPLV